MNHDGPTKQVLRLLYYWRRNQCNNMTRLKSHRFIAAPFTNTNVLTLLIFHSHVISKEHWTTKILLSASVTLDGYLSKCSKCCKKCTKYSHVCGKSATSVVFKMNTLHLKHSVNMLCIFLVSFCDMPEKILQCIFRNAE